MTFKKSGKSLHTKVVDRILISVQEIMAASAQSVKGLIVASANSVMT